MIIKLSESDLWLERKPSSFSKDLSAILSDNVTKKRGSFIGEISKANAKAHAVQYVDNLAGETHTFSKRCGNCKPDGFALDYAGYSIDIASALANVADTGLALSRRKFQHHVAYKRVSLVIPFFGIFRHIEFFGVSPPDSFVL